MVKRIVVALATLALLAALLPATASAAPKYRVSIAVSSKAITLGSSLTISGRVSPNAAGKSLTIQKKLAGGAWKTEKTVTIKSNGTYSYTYKPTTLSTRQYRAYKPKTGSTAAGYSAAITVTVRRPVQAAATVSISTVSPRTLDAGRDISVSGRTSANLKGKTVVLQRLSGTTWVTWVSGRVSTAGTFTLKARASLAGAGQKLRAYAPATSSTKAAASGVSLFTVYGWYYLSDRDTISHDAFGSASASIAGSPYVKSITNYFGFYYGKISYAEYGLNYKCTALRATVGLSDTSRSGASVNYVAALDSVEADLATMTNGRSQPVVLDLTGGYRLRLENRWIAGTRASGTSAIQGVWGNAQIRCAF